MKVLTEHTDKGLMNDCKVFIDFSNCDYERLDDVNEFIQESQTKEGVFVTLFCHNYYYGCTEPFNGYSIRNKNAISTLKREWERFNQNN